MLADENRQLHEAADELRARLERLERLDQEAVNSRAAPGVRGVLIAATPWTPGVSAQLPGSSRRFRSDQGAFTQRNPRWFVPVPMSPLPRVPTM